MTVTDTAGKTDFDTVSFTVGPPNSAPSCGITAPETGGEGSPGDLLMFEATVSDVDVPADWLTGRMTD